MIKIKLFFRSNLGMLVVIIFSLFGVLPLFQPGFFPMHDDTQVARVFEMGKALKDGMFPVRWVLDLGYGYGYPIFNFYAPLPYYFGGLVTLLGFDALLATKVMFLAGILLSGILMYLLAKEFWGKAGGIISGLFYMYAPYHALDIYVRGAVGEFWAYAFIPLAFLGLYKVFQKRTWRWVVIGSVGYAGVILSHNLTALMITPFLLFAILLRLYSLHINKKPYAIRHTLYAIFLGLLLSAFYWLPALLEMKYTNVTSQVGGGADFRNHFVCLEQLWNSQWGFGGSIPGCIDGLSFKVGKTHLILSLIALISGIYLWKKDRLRSVIVIFSFILFLSSVFMTLEAAKFIWEVVPFIEFMQYPWRFLIFVSFFSSFLAGVTVWIFSRLKGGYSKAIRYLSFSILVLLLLYFNTKLFQPQTYYLRTSDFYTGKQHLEWTTSKISDEYMPKVFSKPKNQDQIPKTPIEIAEGKASVVEAKAKTGLVWAEVRSQSVSTVRINIAFFPAWKVFLNDQETSFQVKNNGLYLGAPPGTHIIEARFIQTPIQKFSNLLSLIGVLLVFAVIINKVFLLFRQAEFE